MGIVGWVVFIICGIAFTGAAYNAFRLGLRTSAEGFLTWVLIVGLIWFGTNHVFGRGQNRVYVYSPRDRDYQASDIDRLPPGEAVQGKAEPFRDWVAKVDTCHKERDCTIVPVLFGTTRMIDYSVSAEKEGQFVNQKATPFLDVFDTDSNFASLGEALVSVPGEVSKDNNELFRPSKGLSVLGVRFGSERLDADEHYIFKAYTKYTEDEFQMRLNDKKRAFVYIHGYQTSFVDATFRAAQLATVGEFKGAPIVFSWPSMKGLSKEKYVEAKQNAQKSAEKLKGFLQLVSDALGTDELHIVAHSMGNYALLNAIKELERNPEESDRPTFDQVIMAAPDLSVPEYQSLVQELGSISKGATLYASRKDFALKLSQATCRGRRKDLEDLYHSLTPNELAELEELTCTPRAGYVPQPPENVPVLADGVDAIDVSEVDRGIYNPLSEANHTYHFADSEVFFDMILLMDPKRRAPPHKRQPNIARKEDEEGHEYWWFFNQ